MVHNLYLVDLVRKRLEFPQLVAAAKALYEKWTFDWGRPRLLIEDKGSGTSLIQALKAEGITAYPMDAAATPAAADIARTPRRVWNDGFSDMVNTPWLAKRG